MKIENATAQMRKGVLEYCILSLISNKDLYTSEILIEKCWSWKEQFTLY